jgi:vanillate O-demethylase ferredoxin subunit
MMQLQAEDRLDFEVTARYCGSCLTRLVAGLPDHRDPFMRSGEQARNDAFTPCCSRALSPCLALDL